MDAQQSEQSCEMSVEDLFRRLGIGTEEERLALLQKFAVEQPAEEVVAPVQIIASGHS
jgi:hypothetical protein